MGLEHPGDRFDVEGELFPAGQPYIEVDDERVSDAECPPARAAICGSCVSCLHPKFKRRCLGHFATPDDERKDSDRRRKRRRS